MSAKSRKRMHDIRTMSDRVSDAEKPQRKYIKLAILELEKVRRSKEKRSASEKIKNLDERLVEIEIEQARLIETVYVMHKGEEGPAVNAPHSKKFISQDNQNNQNNTDMNQYNTDFKITY
ncbi:MAG: hypothetical protein ABSA77_09435 [Thermoguttaceae bacterium]|jgi:hypothetical protein